MNLNWNSFEEGFKSHEKSANFLGSILGGSANGGNGITGLLGSILGGQQAAPAPTAPPPVQPININLGEPNNILSPNPGEVHSINRPVAGSSKLAGLIDPNVLRSVLTAQAVHGISNTVMADHNSPSDSPAVEQKKVLLESKYPEVKKLLADPQTKAYLETLLTPDKAYDTPETDIHPTA